MHQCEKQKDRFWNLTYLENSEGHGWVEERREILARHEYVEIHLSGGVKYSNTYRDQTLRSNKFLLIWMKINYGNIIQWKPTWNYRLSIASKRQFHLCDLLCECWRLRFYKLHISFESWLLVKLCLHKGFREWLQSGRIIEDTFFFLFACCCSHNKSPQQFGGLSFWLLLAFLEAALLHHLERPAAWWAAPYEIWWTQNSSV